VHETGLEPWSVVGFRWMDLRLINDAVSTAAVM
jgi:hypothetical protein